MIDLINYLWIEHHLISSVVSGLLFIAWRFFCFVKYGHWFMAMPILFGGFVVGLLFAIMVPAWIMIEFFFAVGGWTDKKLKSFKGGNHE